MADAGRKDFSTQVQEKVTPDSQKSTLDKATESVTTAADKAAAAVLPADSKSTSQQLGDSARGNTNKAEGEAKTTFQQVSDTVTDAVNSASEYISGSGSSTK